MQPERYKPRGDNHYCVMRVYFLILIGQSVKVSNALEYAIVLVVLCIVHNIWTFIE
jgi:hypothetical protein